MKTCFMVRFRFVVRGFLAFAFFSPAAVFALTYTVSAPVADTYVNAADPETNFGSYGALQLTGANNGKGQMSALLAFDLGAAAAAFDTSFGAGQWTIASAVLSLGTNFGQQGIQPNNTRFAAINAGFFEVTWLKQDGWSETGLTYSGLSGYVSQEDVSLGVFGFTAPGNNTVATYGLLSASSFVSDLEAGGIVSLYLSAAAGSEVSYLFNSRSYGTAELRPQLILTASAIPEPATIGLLAGGALLSLAALRRLRRS